MSRILLDTATVLSLVLCLATLGFWVRSLWAFDGLMCDRDTAGVARGYYIYSTRGRLGLVYAVVDLPEDMSNEVSIWWRVIRREYPIPILERTPKWAGFGWAAWIADTPGGKRDRIYSVTAPHAALCAGLLIVPVARVVRVRRARRRSSGRCPACGYDLRATPDRCPECGTTARLRSP